MKNMTKILNFESSFDYLGYEVNAATTCNPLNSFLLNCQLTVSESFSKWKGTVSMVCRAVPPLQSIAQSDLKDKIYFLIFLLLSESNRLVETSGVQYLDLIFMFCGYDKRWTIIYLFSNPIHIKNVSFVPNTTHLLHRI